MKTGIANASDSVWRVVIIEDSPEDRDEIRRLLLHGSERRYRFVEAETGAAGLRAVLETSNGPPDCVVLDYSLPDMDAMEVLPAVIGPDGLTVCPVVVLTGVADMRLGSTVLRAGAQDFIGKSWMTAESLTRAVENAAERWAMTRELQARKTALEASEAQLKLAVEVAGLGVNRIDYATDTVVLDTIAAALFGLEAEVSLPRSTVHATFHPDDKDEIDRLLNQSLDPTGDGTFSMEHRVVHPDGSIRWLNVKKHVIFAEIDGVRRSVTSVLAAVDVTGRKVAEADRLRLLQQVEGERARLADLFRHAPAFMCVLRGPDHVFELANEHYDQLVGHRQLLGRNVRDAFPDIEGQGFIELLDNVYATGEPFIGSGVRLLFSHKPDRPPEERIVDFVYQALRDPSGTITGILVVGIDVTDRKRAEDTVVRQVSELDRLYASTPAGLFQFDADLRFVRVNAWMAAINGRSIEAHIGRTVSEVLKPDVAHTVEDLLSHILQTGKPVLELEIHGPSAANGELRDWLASYYPVRSNDGKIVGVHGVVLDITERKQTEDALRESQQFTRSVLENLFAFVGVMTADGTLTYANRAPVEAAGIAASEVLGKKFWDCHWWNYSSETQAQLRDACERAAGGEMVRYDVPVRMAGDTRVWIDFQVSPLRDKAGRITHLIPSAMDIAVRRGAEQELQEAERQLRQTLMNVSVPTILYADDGTIQLVNQAWTDITGYRIKDIPTISVWTQKAYGEGNAVANKYIDDLFEADTQVDNGEWIVTTATGEKRVWHFSSTPVGREPGGRRLIVSTAIDITERKQSEAAIRTSETRYRRLFEAAKDGILILDGQTGRITDANPYILDVLGLSRAESLGKELWEIGVFADVDASRAAMDELQNQGYVRYEDLPLQSKIGHRREVEVVANVYQENSQRVIQCNIRDITERKKLEDELKRSAEELRKFTNELSEADRRKDEFLATLAHELRNPLAPIRNGLSILRMARLPDQAEKVVGMMDRQLTQMVRLVDDLLDVSRISRGKIDLRSERLDIRSVIEAALETSRPLIEQAGHELAIVLPDEPIFADGDATRLAQVVSNLLTNSAKYTHRGGHIRLTVRRDGDAVAVSVADDGIGIPPAMLDKVFIMFAQVDRTLEKTTGGLGIGLSLVKGLVEMHGGTIEAKSEGEGKGSEFVVRLPVIEPALNGPAVNGRAKEVVPCGRRRILVVDDNGDSANSLGQLLAMLGNEVRTAYDGEAGVVTAATFRPHVVLCDIAMPKVNGYEACRRIRAEGWGQNMVLVALTGWGQDDDREKSADAGFDHHLVKPVEAAILMKLLAGLQPATA